MIRLAHTQKNVEPDLAVFVEVGGRVWRAGDLHLAETSGHFLAAFQYNPAYLEAALRGEVFALDPINLPLDDRITQSTSRYHLLGALFDAAPDAWGRTIMASDDGVSPASMTESRVLLKGRGSGVGAIFFGLPDTHTEDAYPSIDLPTLGDIEQLFETTSAIESGARVDADLRAMLMSSWDMGGARPKALVRDRQGQPWIAKLPRNIDTYSRQRVEWANLEMARAIGMTVPETALHPLPGGDCALLIRRFDRGPTANRYHYLSAVSLISPPADFDKHQMDTPYGASIFSYARVADVVRRISADPRHDIQELFARMVLNILVNNTDDHLKNTGFLMQPENPNFIYRLAPLFDVVTQENSLSHMLHIGPGINNQRPSQYGRVGSLANARAGASQWGLKPKTIGAIIERVQHVVKERDHYYERAGMSADEVKQVEQWVNR